MQKLIFARINVRAHSILREISVLIFAHFSCWTQGDGIQIPSKYKIYCREKHKEMIKNKLQKINICFISMSRTLSQHPNGIHKVKNRYQIT